MAKKYKNVREKNGKFHYRYSIKDANGNRVQKETPGFPSAKEAADAGKIIDAEILNGTYIENKKILINEFADQWLELYKATNVKERTVDLRKSVVKKIKEKFGGLKLQELTTARYQKELNDLKNNENKSQSTIMNFHVVMKMIYQKALELELIKKDITQYVTLPSFSKTVEELEINDDVPKYLEKEELAILLQKSKELDSPQAFRLLFVLAYTGMRIGELCALKLKDVDEVNKKISITKTLYVPGKLKNYKLNTPKNKSSIRKIDVSSRVISIIKEQIAWKNQFRMEYRRWFNDESDFIFFTEGNLMGYPLRLYEAENYMTDALKAAGINYPLTPHSLRHTYTSLMAEAGVELEAIQKLLGHSSDHTTKAVYLHVTKERRRAAVEKLDSLMDGVI
ncbi:tyrosine-type recombinase/integrase [Paenibacillus polymyxa]|uniref:tyrosine-type recombinase/integrase n=1 Tax=Paenibacillus polymyxa TaxID=1406 RepID=UPI0008C20703|nr:tyrosine-type recombinase/integrase [Paenibacillus polymyxa]SEI77466.1 Site-specific recombinase XerD [Paenibacillus polymyxa]